VAVDLHRVERKSGERPGALLRTLVLVDLVDSTTLIERLGDATAAQLIRRHDRLVRLLIRRHGGREIDKTDGFLALFERPIQGVAFSLAYQRRLSRLARALGQPLAARAGVHVGDVIVWDNRLSDVELGAKRVEVEGLAKAVTARLMNLAEPGQILMSGVALELARRSVAELGVDPGTLQWLAHGEYDLKGLPEPVKVFEVGERGVAPFRTPSASSKAAPAGISPFRRRALVVAAVVLASSISGGALLLTNSEHSLAFGERDWIVIADMVTTNGDDALGSTLATAFRIGVEQSRFVNILPDPVVHEALARMQHPRDSHVDRSLAAEVALREQARAVIVPAVVQYGRRVRLSAELIDPNGTRTVSTLTADADAPENVLPAMDRLVSELRRSLGESLKQIKQSKPLEKVTTADLQALRAYSQALGLVRDGEIDEAVALLTYATQRDPRFASAYGLIGSLMLTQQRYGDARQALNNALSSEDRLTERERLFIDAQRARFVDPKTALERWQVYANLYPDQGTGQNNLGNAYYIAFLDYRAAELALAAASETRNLWRNHTLHALAYARLAQEKVQEARETFEQALALSPAPDFFGLGDVLMVAGKVDEAARYLDSPKLQAPIFELERAMRRATLSIVAGDLDGAARVLTTALDDAKKLPVANSRWRITAALVAIRAAQGDTSAARVMAAEHVAELLRAAQMHDSNAQVIEHLLYAGAWAARLGLQSQARESLVVARQYGNLERYPVRARLATLLESELQLASGGSQAALDLIRVDQVKDLWEVHELRGRIWRALNDQPGELVEMRWMTSHPGLAHAQWIDQFLGQQARALAIRDATTRLAEFERRR
jgi:putative peptide modification system cyclase